MPPSAAVVPPQVPLTDLTGLPWYNPESLTPFTSKLCNWCSVVCIIMAIWAALFYDISETIPPISAEEDPWVVGLLRFTATLAFGGFIMESSFMVFMRVLGMKKAWCDNPIFQKRILLNGRMTMVFALLTTMYSCMAFDFQWVHKGWLAEYHGGKQIVYSVRYIEWVCCAPIVLSVNGQVDPGPDGKQRNLLLPSSFLTGIYCLISWQGLVVKDVFAGWVLISFAFISWIVASTEQLVFAWHIRKAGKVGKFRCAIVTYLVVMISIYGVIYLLPIPGWIPPAWENKFYTCGDISFKMGTALIMRMMEDMDTNEKLRASAESMADDLRRMINTSSVPIFGVDTQCRINEWNDKVEELTCLPKEQAMGMPFFDMLPSTCRAEGEAVIRKALAGDRTSTFEIEMKPKDTMGGKDAIKTKRATLVVSATPRRDKGGAVVGGVICVGHDLTEIAAIKEADMRKMRFMAVVSHELRSPLHGIIGLADNLITCHTNENEVRQLKMVKNCASRLLDLVVSIMEMASMVSKDEQGKAKTAKPLSRDPVELPKIVEEVVLLVRSSVDKQGLPLVKPSVTLINQVKQSMPIIEADSHKVTQVFYNLITNACKFTRKGKIVIDSVFDIEGKWVEVSVADTGKGIAPQARERIFKPFEQEDNSESREYEGIGLGLSIALELVHRHGGHISLDSEEGQGTTFSVRLPLAMGGHVPKKEEVPQPTLTSESVTTDGDTPGTLALMRQRIAGVGPLASRVGTEGAPGMSSDLPNLPNLEKMTLPQLERELNRLAEDLMRERVQRREVEETKAAVEEELRILGAAKHAADCELLILGRAKQEAQREARAEMRAKIRELKERLSHERDVEGSNGNAKETMKELEEQLSKERDQLADFESKVSLLETRLMADQKVAEEEHAQRVVTLENQRVELHSRLKSLEQQRQMMQATHVKILVVIENAKKRAEQMKDIGFFAAFFRLCWKRKVKLN